MHIQADLVDDGRATLTSTPLMRVRSMPVGQRDVARIRLLR
jgi:hypothetical protein